MALNNSFESLELPLFLRYLKSLSNFAAFGPYFNSRLQKAQYIFQWDDLQEQLLGWLSSGPLQRFSGVVDRSQIWPEDAGNAMLSDE